MILLFACSAVVLCYVYVAYPLLLRLIVWARGARPVRHGDVTPSMSLVISAFNEEAVIRRKLENALSLDYPPGLLEIVVVSDASDDGTDAIVSEYAGRGVVLHRQSERRGKTAGLNRTVPLLIGEVVVFSDANAMYEPDALRKLARNFADPEVGCVTGEARYLSGSGAAAEVGERAYWDYEIQIKRLETDLGSMVGGDGAIYAIRRTLWRELPGDAINDFLNPLQIVAAGARAVYEPEAVCYEETAGGMRTEYRRRVRIVSRSWRAVFQAREVLNPFRVGLFAWSLVSHKVLRWAGGLFSALALIALLSFYLEALVRWPVSSIGLVVLGCGVAAGTDAGRRATAMLTYFAVINTASVVGLLKGSLGRVSGVWAATPRQVASGSRAPTNGFSIPVGQLFLIAGVVIAAVSIGSVTFGEQQATVVVFWASASALGYMYIAYPILLAAFRLVAKRPVKKADAEPSVCLLIAAHNEAAGIEAKLHNALAMDYPPSRLDIVVASDGSVDETNAIVQRFAPKVRLLAFSPRRGKTATINDAIRSVTSSIVVLSDANALLEPDAIRSLVRNFADPEVGAVSGDVRLVGERAALGLSEDLYYTYERWVQRAESDIGSMVGADGALYAVRRELFVAPADDTILDDMAIPMAVVRSGRRVVFEPAARAQEQGFETVGEEFARKTRVIAGAVQFMRRADSAVPLRFPQVIISLISHKAIRWLSPAFAACTLVTSIALSGVSTGYAGAAIGQAALLAIGLAGCVPVFRRMRLVAIAHYFCLLQAAAAVGFLRGARGRQSVLWHRFERVHSPSPVASND